MKVESLICPGCKKVHNVEMEDTSIAIIECHECLTEFKVSIPTKKWFFWTKLLHKRQVVKNNV